MYDDGQMPDDQASRLEELRGKIKENIDEATGFIDSELSEFREKANNLYYGRPYGDENPGYSQVVSRDVMETIEWITAQLLRIFTGDRFCEFEPHGPEDVDQSAQQTDYVNYVLMQECNGTLLFYDWFKEALWHRTGIVHWGYCDYYEPITETYTGLDDGALQALLSDADTTLTEHSPREAQMPDGSMIVLHDVRVRRVKADRKLKIEAIPSEEFMIATNSRSIEDATFIGHKARRTRSDLRKEGIPANIVDSLSAGEATDLNDTEAQSRNVDSTRVQGETFDDDRFWLYTCYIKFDMDGDGMDELLRVRYVGDTIVDVEPALEAPYADICPMRTPHRFIGMSYTDLVEDIQRIKTVLLRQSLDNLYLTNKPQREVVEGQVNPTDLLQAAVGGTIRVKAPGMLRDLQVPSALAPSLQMVAYMDNVREERTGTGAASQGRDADQIHETASGMAQMVSQAQMRVELVARLFAEGGVKRLFVGLYNAIVRNQDPARMVRLRGKFVQVDPREWRERNNAKVTVGLGVGTKDSQIRTLTGILGTQMQMLQAGLPLVTPDKIKYTMSKLIEAAGYSNVQSFVAEPEEIPPPAPPPPSDAIQIAQMQMKIEAEKRKLEQMRAQADATVAVAKIRADTEIKVAQGRADEQQAIRDHEYRMAQLRQTKELDDERLEQENTQFYDKLMQDAVLAREQRGADERAAREEAAKDEALMAKLGDEPGEAAEATEAESENGEQG